MTDVRDWHRDFAAANAPISVFEHDDAGLVGIEFNFAPGRQAHLVRADNSGGLTRYTLICFCRRTRTLVIHDTDAPVVVLERVCMALVNHGCLKRRST